MTEPGKARLGAWLPGDSIVRREVWHGRPLTAWGGTVVPAWAQPTLPSD